MPASAPRVGFARRRAPTAEQLGPRFERFVRGLVRPVVFFDTETTGTDPLSDRIVEISIVRVMPHPIGVEEPRTWRVNPGVRIPVEASEIHGIYNEDVADKPTFAQLADEILELFDGADLAGFNVSRFDIRVLQAELLRVRKPLELSALRVVDTQVIFHRREPRNLAAAVRFYCGKPLEGAHGAEADTIATLEVFAGQLARYDDLAVDVDGLHAVSNSINQAFVDVGRRFAWRDNEPVFNFGKLKGTPLREAAGDPDARSYLNWILQGNFEEDAKALVRDALAGQIRRRPPRPA